MRVQIEKSKKDVGVIKTFFNLILGKREISPVMNRMEDSLEHIIDYDIMDSEIHE